MSLALIQESAKEVRRLAIAGSPLAVGDFRLKKLIAPLEQAGAKVPVFAQVAKSIDDLVNGKEAESASNLLSLSTLLNAILYTQGRTGAEGELSPLQTFNAGRCGTKTPARVLKPIIEALTTTGSGRFEIVKSAFERGAFNDLRLIEPSIRALEDNYPELADFVAEKILPAYGKAIIPLLKQGLNLKGKKSDARRLHVIQQVDPAAATELLAAALDQGSADVRIEAIVGLSRHEEYLPLIIEQSKSKNKAVRAVALKALARHDRPEVNQIFIDLIRGKATDLLADPFRIVENEQVFGLLIAETSAAMEKAFSNDNDATMRFYQLLQCFKTRTDARTETFLLNCFAQCDKLAKVKASQNNVISGTDLIRDIAEVLYGIGSSQCLCAILANQQKIPADSFDLVLRSALRVWPPEKVYDEFAPLLAQKRGAGKTKSQEIQRAIWSACGREADPGEGEDTALAKVTWDPRWLDAGIKNDHFYIVRFLAPPGHREAIAYLKGKLDGKITFEVEAVIEGLAHCQCAEVTDLYLDLLAKRAKKSTQWDYELHALLHSARHLPLGDLPKLDAFAAKLDEKFVDRYLEALEPLRLAAQTK